MPAPKGLTRERIMWVCSPCRYSPIRSSTWLAAVSLASQGQMGRETFPNLPSLVAQPFQTSHHRLRLPEFHDRSAGAFTGRQRCVCRFGLMAIQC